MIDLTITDKETAAEALTKGSAFDEFEERWVTGPFSHVVSIVSSPMPDGTTATPPGGVEVWNNYDASKLRLEFDDVGHFVQGYHPPTEDHVRQMVTFGQERLTPDSHLLIHCGQGVSRSTAAAIVILTAFYNGDADRGFKEAVQGKKAFHPLQRILELGSMVLGVDLLLGWDEFR